MGWEGDFFLAEAMHMITFTGYAYDPFDHGAAGGFPSSLPLLDGFSPLLPQLLLLILLIILIQKPHSSSADHSESEEVLRGSSYSVASPRASLLSRCSMKRLAILGCAKILYKS